jgi:hypothetical protein
VSVSVWIHGAESDPKIQREFHVQRLSPVRELRAIGGLPHSGSAMQESNVSRHRLFCGWGESCGAARNGVSRCSSVVGSPARRELGQKHSFQVVSCWVAG